MDSELVSSSRSFLVSHKENKPGTLSVLLSSNAA